MHDMPKTLKLDGWKTSLSFWEGPSCQVHSGEFQGGGKLLRRNWVKLPTFLKTPCKIVEKMKNFEISQLLKNNHFCLDVSPRYSMGLIHLPTKLGSLGGFHVSHGLNSLYWGWSSHL